MGNGQCFPSCFHFFQHQPLGSLICPTLFPVPLSVWVEEAVIPLCGTQEHKHFWKVVELRHLRTCKTWGVTAIPSAPKAEEMLYQNWLVILSSGENSTAPEIPKLPQDATLQFLYETSRIKGMADTEIPYSQLQHEFRARTDTSPSKAIPRRHPQKHFSISSARQSLLKQRAQVCRAAGHTIRAPPLLLTSPGTQEHKSRSQSPQDSAAREKKSGRNGGDLGRDKLEWLKGQGSKTRIDGNSCWKLSALTCQLRKTQDPEQWGDTGQHQEEETEKQGHESHVFQDYVIPE